MKILVLLKIAITAIKRNKIRSLLTMLGIIIGVASVIAMLAVGEGSSSSIKNQISSMGTNLISLKPASQNRGGVHMGFENSQSLEISDVEYVQKNCDLIQAISPEVRSGGQVIFGSNNWPSTMMGGNEDYNYIKKYDLTSGRNFTAQEVKSAAKVCLVGQTIVENIFGENIDPVGESIRFDKIPFKIIGILDGKGENTFGQDQDDILIAPYTTVMKRIIRQTHLRDIVMSATSEDVIDKATEQVEEAMRLSHKLKDIEENDFEIRTQAELISSFSSVSDIMIVLLGSISAISLIVGGIGIMNIMLASVTERTREIGIRRAIGAKRRQIICQFLIETVVLSTTGGLIGLGVGTLIPYLITHFSGMETILTWQGILLPLFISGSIGILFGLYPAVRAAQVDPIIALRHE